MIVQALVEPWGWPSALAGISAQLIKQDPAVRACIERAVTSWPRRLSLEELFGTGELAAIASDRLLRSLLEATPNQDISLERFLTNVRFVMLQLADGPAGAQTMEANVLELCCALARQCFINDYVFDCSTGELEQVQKVCGTLSETLRNGGVAPALWPAIVAAYRPLHSLPEAVALLQQSWPDAVTALLVQQVREPHEERRYAASMPALTPIESGVSIQVRQQYEENPYPRWVKTAPPSPPLPFDAWLRRQLPHGRFQRLNKNSIDILIAGCGTGRHAIEVAQQYAGARPLAIDLSLASLGYAKRKLIAHGLDNIELAQADILRLGSLDRTFDVIEAVGVLHHLADPVAGWRVLLSLLRPRGFMRLGLYSALGRQSVVAVHKFIAERGFRATVDDIRKCRQALIDVDDQDPMKVVTAAADFFSTSECRDALFHVQEGRLTLPTIKDILVENDLDFLGFDIGARIPEQYAARFPQDKARENLDLWHIFETENPRTFIGMYQFWVQRKS